MEIRSERKWRINNRIFFQLIRALKRSNFCFKDHYKPRWINSVYYDDFFHYSVHQNLNGEYYKEKNRLRWYGNESFTNSVVFEVKKKFGTISNKTRHILFDEKIMLDNHFIDKTYSKVLKTFPSKIRLKPKTMTKYLRYYFLSQDEKIRATIDTNISYKKILNNKFGSEKFIDCYNILELKYNIKHDEMIRKNLNLKNLRLSRNSKFINSFFFQSL